MNLGMPCTRCELNGVCVCVWSSSWPSCSLCRTELQYLSGTRGAVDHAETIAEFTQMFATDFRVVEQFAQRSDIAWQQVFEQYLSQKCL